MKKCKCGNSIKYTAQRCIDCATKNNDSWGICPQCNEKFFKSSKNKIYCSSHCEARSSTGGEPTQGKRMMNNPLIDGLTTWEYAKLHGITRQKAYYLATKKPKVKKEKVVKMPKRKQNIKMPSMASSEFIFNWDDEI